MVDEAQIQTLVVNLFSQDAATRQRALDTLTKNEIDRAEILRRLDDARRQLNSGATSTSSERLTVRIEDAQRQLLRWKDFRAAAEPESAEGRWVVEHSTSIQAHVEFLEKYIPELSALLWRMTPR